LVEGDDGPFSPDEGDGVKGIAVNGLLDSILADSFDPMLPTA
jgi:hypothetical protein